ncbi:MAG: Rrf2 family transcriptional regulator [Chthoniobacterales bacterium]|nr:Rrf2 family transcriptional regulator [Chthoniobacterales bacterium]MCX7712582.1 Rrf2 family transcriptional regulator [Chthoniobacterales bacterium]
MKLTKSTEYGIRALAILAAYHGKVEPPISIHQITSHDPIPIPFLEQILFRLRKNSIIQAKRGKLGGYWLARPPHQINLAEVIEALEPNTFSLTSKENSSNSDSINENQIDSLSPNSSSLPESPPSPPSLSSLQNTIAKVHDLIGKYLNLSRNFFSQATLDQLIPDNFTPNSNRPTNNPKKHSSLSSQNSKTAQNSNSAFQDNELPSNLL